MTGVFRRVVLAPAVIAFTVLLLTTVPLWLILAAVLSPVVSGRLRPLRLLWLAIMRPVVGSKTDTRRGAVLNAKRSPSCRHARST